MAHRGRQSADDALLVALAAGKTASEAAEQARVGVRTVTRRLADPGFRRRVTELRGEMTARALGKLADAADKLRALLNADSESVQLAAAKALLELGTKLRDSVEIEERLSALERRETHGPQSYGPAGAA